MHGYYLTESRKRHLPAADSKKNSKPYVNDNCSHCKNQASQGKVAVSQFDLFASSSPVISLEPVPTRSGRVRLTINQLDCRWELIPNLKMAEAKALLEFIAAEGIAFDLDLNEGHPIESERLHWATEQVICGDVRL